MTTKIIAAVSPTAIVRNATALFRGTSLFLLDLLEHPVHLVQLIKGKRQDPVAPGKRQDLTLYTPHGTLYTPHPGTEVIIDDLAGRKCAASLDISLRGTLGIVLVAKRRGLIPRARPVIESMMSAGLYLSRRVLDEALRRVGE